MSCFRHRSITVKSSVPGGTPREPGGARQPDFSWRFTLCLRDGRRPAIRMGRNLLHALVIEDDLATSRFICEGLEEAGFRALGCYNGHAGLAHIESAKWDVIVLDRMLPGQLDGMSLLKAMREQGDQTPVIVVSAINSTEERILGLRSGGDDYLPKPFALGELLARIESVLRRMPAPGDTTVLRVADLVLRAHHARQPRRPGHSFAGARVPPARVSDAPRRPGHHPRHAAGKSLALPFQSPVQYYRRADQPPAQQNRPRLSARADPHRARGGLPPVRRPGPPR